MEVISYRDALISGEDIGCELHMHVFSRFQNILSILGICQVSVSLPGR